MVRWQFNHKEGKLTESQYRDLEMQWQKTPAIGDGSMHTGEHYILAVMLNQWGWSTNGKEELMDLAEELLSRGWE